MSFNYKIDKERIINLYKNLFQKNKELYILGGELDPSFYATLVKECFPLAKDNLVNIICSSEIAVEDEPFQEYHTIHNNHLGNWWHAKRKDSWWKVHPIIENAYNNHKTNIFITKQNIEPHFCLGEDSKEVIIAFPHVELEDYKIEYSKDQKDVLSYKSKWQDIKSQKSHKWNKKTNEIIFKPRHIIERELFMEKEIEKEFSTLRN